MCSESRPTLSTVIATATRARHLIDLGATLLQPTFGVVTAVGPVHIEHFESVDAIAREKAAVLESLPKDGTAYLDADGEWFDVLRAYAPCALITTSIGRVASSLTP